MSGERRMVHARNAGSTPSEARDRASVCRMALHAQREGPQAAQREPGFEMRNRRAARTRVARGAGDEVAASPDHPRADVAVAAEYFPTLCTTRSTPWSSGRHQRRRREGRVDDRTAHRPRGPAAKRRQVRDVS
jgi:hypothetical protein